jgi:hypothetical protein
MQTATLTRHPLIAAGTPSTPLSTPNLSQRRTRRRIQMLDVCNWSLTKRFFWGWGWVDDSRLSRRSMRFCKQTKMKYAEKKIFFFLQDHYIHFQQAQFSILEERRFEGASWRDTTPFSHQLRRYFRLAVNIWTHSPPF